jgi:hypothetical protein
MNNANIDMEKYNALLMRDAKRKHDVKLYQTRKNVKNDYFKSFFDKHATNDDKKQLKTIVENVKIDK